MPHFDELYPGRFLKGKALPRPMTVRILALVGEELEGDDGVKHKAILKYRAIGPDGQPVDGEMVFAKSNAMLAEAIFGTGDYAQWIGHLVTVGYDPNVVLGKEKVGGLRIVGSPELKQSMTVNVKRPRRKTPDRYVLQPTDNQGRVRGAAQQPAAARGATHPKAREHIAHGGDANMNPDACAICMPREPPPDEPYGPHTPMDQPRPPLGEPPPYASDRQPGEDG